MFGLLVHTRIAALSTPSLTNSVGAEQPLNQWGDPISSVGDGKKYNEYGDELVSDEAAGGGLMDSMKDFFGEVKDFFDDE
jgi:hypothetical protein